VNTDTVEQPPSDGQAAGRPTWKLLSFLKRRQDLTAEQFIAYWRDVHAPLMQEQSNFWRHVRRYIQNYAISGSDSPIGLPDTHNGVSELWFDSPEELRAAFSEPDFEVLRADAREFVDLGGVISWVAEFVYVKDPGPTDIKLFAAGHASPGLTRLQSQTYWHDQHTRVLAQDAPDVWRLMASYNQSHTRQLDDLPLSTIIDDYDFCAEVGMDSIQAMHELFTHEDYLTIVRPDELRFASVHDSLACATRESVIYDAAAR
jgi:uncharacterized protein (TIGR02118 family)